MKHIFNHVIGLKFAVAGIMGGLAMMPVARAELLLYWTEAGEQPGPGQPGPAYVNSGRLDGTAMGTVYSITGQSGGGFNGVESAGGSLLVAFQGSRGTRVTATDYENRILLGSGYDVDFEAGQMFVATGPSGSVSIDGWPVTAQGFVTAIDAVGDYLYFSNVYGPGLSRMRLDGSELTSLISGPTIYDFEVTANAIYFADFYTGTISRSAVDGTNIENFITGASGVNGIEVIADAIIWSELYSGDIKKADLTGGNISTLFTGLSGLRGVTLFDLAPLPPSAVPEPASAGTGLAVGAFLVALHRRRKRNGSSRSIA